MFEAVKRWGSQVFDVRRTISTVKTDAKEHLAE